MQLLERFYDPCAGRNFGEPSSFEGDPSEGLAQADRLRRPGACFVRKQRHVQHQGRDDSITDEAAIKAAQWRRSTTPCKGSPRALTPSLVQLAGCVGRSEAASCHRTRLGQESADLDPGRGNFGFGQRVGAVGSSHFGHPHGTPGTLHHDRHCSQAGIDQGL